LSGEKLSKQKRPRRNCADEVDAAEFKFAHLTLLQAPTKMPNHLEVEAEIGGPTDHYATTANSDPGKKHEDHADGASKRQDNEDGHSRFCFLPKRLERMLPHDANQENGDDELSFPRVVTQKYNAGLTISARKCSHNGIICKQMDRPMRLMLPLILALATTAPAQASNARYHFCWIGEGGYTMHGMIEFPGSLLGTGIITEEDVTGFVIEGAHNGVPVGSWSLNQRLPDTSWILSFDTNSMEFPTGGIRSLHTYQAWNAHGGVNDCGVGGFGFNAGNWAQDVCIDNTFIEASSIERDTPLQAYPMNVPLACETAAAIM